MILTRGNEQRVFIFKAKDQCEAMKIADTEFKRWKFATSYEVYDLTKQKFTSKEPNIILPYLASYHKAEAKKNE